MDIYDELGVKKIINAAGTYTVIGGSRMSETTLNAMKEAGSSFVEIADFQKAVYKGLAELTNNEDACVTTGAIAGIYLSVAAAISRLHNAPLKLLSKEAIQKSEVMMFRSHRNPYDRGIDVLGCKLVELGYPNIIDMITAEDFEYAINENTACVMYVEQPLGGWAAQGALPLEVVIEICKGHNVPVIVDCAAQVPPKSNLWHFTKEMGADIALFSGGKDLKGPQTTGLCVGKKDFISWLNKNNFPNYGIGRMHKVGREELAGIYNAVKEYVEEDEEKRDLESEGIVNSFVESFSAEEDAFFFERVFPNEAGQPMPRAKMYILSDNLTAEIIRDTLLNLDRAIYTAVENGHIYINPMCLTKEEADYVLESINNINKREK